MLVQVECAVYQASLMRWHESNRARVAEYRQNISFSHVLFEPRRKSAGNECDALEWAAKNELTKQLIIR